jgi:hypothetical protein
VKVWQVLTTNKAFSHPKGIKGGAPAPGHVFELDPAALDPQHLQQASLPLVLASLLTTYLPQNQVGTDPILSINTDEC